MKYDKANYNPIFGREAPITRRSERQLFQEKGLSFMLKKERWIVYPLLMLSLFSSLVGVQVIKAQQDVLDSVVTKELIIINDKGIETASIKNTDAGAELLLNGTDGKNMVELSAHERIGASLSLNDPNHKAGTMIWAASKGGNISLSYDGGQQVSLAADKIEPMLWLGNFPEPGKRVTHVILGAFLEQGGVLDVRNEKGEKRASIFRAKDGSGGLWVYDKNGDKSRSYAYY